MWQYRTAQWNPDVDEPEEQWQAARASEGWEPPARSVGSWVVINTRRVKVWRLRRWVQTAHEPAEPPVEDLGPW